MNTKEKKQTEEAGCGGDMTLVENRVYTVYEAAGILRIHPNTVRRLCREGRIKHGQMKKPLLITGWALRSFLETALPVKN